MRREGGWVKTDEVPLIMRNWQRWGRREELMFSFFLDPEFFLHFCFVFGWGVGHSG